MTTDTYKESETYKQARKDIIEFSREWWQSWIERNKMHATPGDMTVFIFSINQFLEELGESDPWTVDVKTRLKKDL